MARPLRFQYPGAIYHVMARGDGGKVVFESDDSRLVFLKRKGDGRKALLAAVLRRRTAVGAGWIAERLAMGHPGSVSRQVDIVKRDRKLQNKPMIWRKCDSAGADPRDIRRLAEILNSDLRLIAVGCRDLFGSGVNCRGVASFDEPLGKVARDRIVSHSKAHDNREHHEPRYSVDHSYKYP